MKQRPEIDCSIIISASHNPYDDNGIKIMDSRTGKLALEDELMISQLFHDATVPEIAMVRSTAPGTATDYCETIITLFPANFLAGKRIVIDAAHGATYQVAPRIFRALGAELIVINNQPTGYNINEQCGALHPDELVRTVIAEQAALGFAFDGDGDRVVAVNCEGEVCDGDDLLAILAEHPAYAASDTIVGTSMTNEGFVQYLKQQQKKLIRTAVGDKYVAEQLTNNQWLLGGETSGHIILNDIISTGDGILAALRVLEVVQMTGNWSLKTFMHYPQVMINMPVAARKDLASSPLATIIKDAQEDF